MSGEALKDVWMDVAQSHAGGTKPTWHLRIPLCSTECPQHDGKRCRLLGHRPDTICEPVVTEMARLLDSDGEQQRLLIESAQHRTLNTNPKET